MTPLEKLNKANADYHEACEEIFCDDDIDPDIEKRAEIKAKFGSMVNAVFNMMKQANAVITPHYEE